MSKPRSFTAALRQLEQGHQAERLRPGAANRIARRLDAELLDAELPRRRRRFIPMVSFAAGAATVLAVFTLGTEPQTAVRDQGPGPAPMHASWQVGGDNCHATRGETELTLDGRCRVVVPAPGMVIESRRTTQLRAAEHGVVMLGGTAIFEVEPDIEGPSRQVLVPGGTIEVHGTRFSVVVYEDQGHVDLLDGAIRFIADDGRVHEIEPGERYRFSARTTVAAATEPASTEPAPATEPISTELALDEEPIDAAVPLAAGERLAALATEEARDPRGSRGSSRARARRPSPEELSAIVTQVTELRAQRQYRAAVSLLRGALAERWDRRTREVLSYELGTILSTQLPDREAACAHWVEHREQFPAGRYARAVDRAEERLSCSDPDAR
ncbi:MAG: FecR domain-containing protein [Nannocystaceae bacterium]